MLNALTTKWMLGTIIALLTSIAGYLAWQHDHDVQQAEKAAEFSRQVRQEQQKGTSGIGNTSKSFHSFRLPGH